jgi:hypothetical protein
MQSARRSSKSGTSVDLLSAVSVNFKSPVVQEAHRYQNPQNARPRLPSSAGDPVENKKQSPQKSALPLKPLVNDDRPPQKSQVAVKKPKAAGKVQEVSSLNRNAAESAPTAPFNALHAVSSLSSSSPNLVLATEHSSTPELQGLLGRLRTFIDINESSPYTDSVNMQSPRISARKAQFAKSMHSTDVDKPPLKIEQNCIGTAEVILSCDEVELQKRARQLEEDIQNLQRKRVRDQQMKEYHYRRRQVDLEMETFENKLQTQLSEQLLLAEADREQGLQECSNLQQELDAQIKVLQVYCYCLLSYFLEFTFV